MRTFLDFQSELNSGKIKNVYYVAALDNYFVSKSSALLREKLFGSKENKDNFFLKYADETPLQEIIDLSQSFSSLFSQKKIIVIKRCEKFSRKLEDLFAFLEKIDSDTIILAVFDKDYLTEKKLLNDNFYDFSELPPTEFSRWVKTEFESREINIEADALEFFISSIPHSFDLLITEIEKISNHDFEGTKKNITKDLILKFIGYDREYSPDELLHSIVTKNHSRAMKILDNLINSNGLNEIYLLSIIGGYYMDLISFKTKGFENPDYPTLGKYRLWGARASFAKKFHKSLNLPSLEASLKRILDTDMKLKTTMLDSKILMTSLVEELINA